jgi:hypothetical protein
MGFKKCPQCGSEFYADEAWKRICYPCWAHNAGRSTHKHGERKTNRQRFDAHFTAKPELVLDPDLLKRLIHLCHPDKHGNSAMSVAVTQKLLELRTNT